MKMSAQWTIKDVLLKRFQRSIKSSFTKGNPSSKMFLFCLFNLPPSQKGVLPLSGFNLVNKQSSPKQARSVAQIFQKFWILGIFGTLVKAKNRYFEKWNRMSPDIPLKSELMPKEHILSNSQESTNFSTIVKYEVRF